MDMDFNEILFAREGGVAILTLNRPDRLNSFTGKMYQEIREIMEQIKRDDRIKALIITGAGKGFCSGWEISELSGTFVRPRTGMPASESRFESLQQIGALALDMADVDKPVIAAINGMAVASGLSIALLCDIRLASEDARFGATWMKIGLAPDMATTYYLPRIVGISKATEMMLDGEIIDADEGRQIGLVSRVVSSRELMSAAGELGDRIAAGPSIAIELTKRGLQRTLFNNLKAQLDYETYSQNICRQTEDAREGVRALLDKRVPRFKGR